MWTEDYIESIPREDAKVERKSSLLFDFANGGNEGKVRDELAKQLSAFANTGGGSIILGVDNQGKIDGGIPLVLKGRQSTKEWLEDIIPQLTEPEIVGVRVLDIMRKGANSKIASDRAIYVVDVRDCDRAPHQSSRDRVYYVRLGSKSQPANDRMIQDIRNRTRHPKIVLEEICISHASYEHQSDREGSLSFGLQLSLHNVSGLRAENICLSLSINTTTGLSCYHVEGAQVRTGNQPGSILLELDRPFHPDMINFGIDTLTVQAMDWPIIPTGRGPLFKIDGQAPEDVVLTIAIYADNAPVKTYNLKFLDVDVHHKLSEELSRSRWEAFIPRKSEPGFISLGRRHRR